MVTSASLPRLTFYLSHKILKTLRQVVTLCEHEMITLIWFHYSFYFFNAFSQAFARLKGAFFFSRIFFIIIYQTNLCTATNLPSPCCSTLLSFFTPLTIIFVLLKLTVRISKLGLIVAKPMQQVRVYMLPVITPEYFDIKTNAK